MIAKMWINAHHRFQLGIDRDTLPQKCRDRIFSICLEIVESCLLLERGESTKQWRWTFRNYVPWQALAFSLSKLCTSTRCETADEAWILVQNAFEEWADVACNKGHDLLWLHMRKLMAMAQQARVLQMASVVGVKFLADSAITNGPPPASNLEASAMETDLVAASSGCAFVSIEGDTGYDGFQWTAQELDLINEMEAGPFSLWDWDQGSIY
jgi:hypothetical protein